MRHFALMYTFYLSACNGMIMTYFFWVGGGGHTCVLLCQVVYSYANVMDTSVIFLSDLNFLKVHWCHNVLHRFILGNQFVYNGAIPSQRYITKWAGLKARILSYT